MSVSLRNPGTGQTKVQQEGWSWGCFLGAGFLGLPLFKRGLMVWGAAMLVLDVATLIVGWISTDRAESLSLWMSAIVLAASVFFGMKANAMATERDLANGWEYTDRRRQWLD